MENKDLHEQGIMFCTFKDMDKEGNKKQCTTKVSLSKINVNNQNNNYCDHHQKFVDKINYERKQEYIKEYKEQMTFFIDNQLKQKEDPTTILKQLLFLFSDAANDKPLTVDLAPPYVAKPTFFECDVKNCKNEAGDELGIHMGRLDTGLDYQLCIPHELTDSELKEKGWNKLVEERLQK